jgi:hypothetical protein
MRWTRDRFTLLCNRKYVGRHRHFGVHCCLFLQDDEVLVVDAVIYKVKVPRNRLESPESGWAVSTTPRPLYTRYPLYRRLGRPQGLYGRVRKISPIPGFDPRTVQPVASHYIDWAITARAELYTRHNYSRWSQGTQRLQGRNRNVTKN